jgi:predicted NAD/FAD-dependent oxidoreductase
MKAGHRIRQLGNTPDNTPVRSIPVVVVGAGIAGLSAAWRMVRGGHEDFTVLELEGRAGGTSTFGTDGVVPYPWAAHYLPLPSERHESLCSLLLEMGVVERDCQGSLIGKEPYLVREPEERLFVGGQWIDGIVPKTYLTALDKLEFARFRKLIDGWVSYRDSLGRRAFVLPSSYGSDAPEVAALDRISAKNWLVENNFHSKPLIWWLEYGCRDDYGTNLDTTSAWALLFYHAARLENPGGQTAPFLTWSEGNGRVVRHLESVVGDRLKCDQLVTDVFPQDNHVYVTVFDLKAERFEVLKASYVILATPTFVTKYIVRPFRANLPTYFAAFSYSPWLVANLHLDSRPRSHGVPLAWDNVVYGGSSLGYVSATHQTLEDDGPTVWTYYQPFADSVPDMARQRLSVADQEMAWEAVVAELSGAHPDLASKVKRMDVWHWGHAMVRPVPGFLFGNERKKAAEPFGAIHFAHTDLSGLPLLDEAHFHGVRAADHIIRLLRGI